MKTPLWSLSRHEYATLQNRGVLWQLYPEATGDWVQDCAGRQEAARLHPDPAPFAHPVGPAGGDVLAVLADR